MAKIPENVLDILGRCRAEGNVLFLPAVQLDRKEYVAVNKVLENMAASGTGRREAMSFQTEILPICWRLSY